MDIGELKDLYRVQISPDENKVYIELAQDKGVAIDVDDKIIEDLIDVFAINWEEL